MTYAAPGSPSAVGWSSTSAADIVRHDIALAVLLTADALLSRGWEPARDVRQRLLNLAAAHPTFTWTSHVAA